MMPTTNGHRDGARLDSLGEYAPAPDSAGLRAELDELREQVKRLAAAPRRRVSLSDAATIAALIWLGLTLVAAAFGAIQFV